jgi:hypothetical protein
MSKIDELQTQNSDLKKQLTQSEPFDSEVEYIYYLPEHYLQT